MDPLSISASIVALIGGATTVVRGLDKLQSLRHAPAELKALLNEVADLQVVLTSVKESLECLRGLGPQIPHDALRNLPDMIDRATKTIEDLNSFVSGNLLKGDPNPAGGVLKVSRRTWLGKEKKLAAFRGSIKECKENLGIVLLSSTSRIIPHMLLNIQEVMLVDRDRFTRSAEAMEQMAERFAAHPALVQSFLKSCGADAVDHDTSTTPTNSPASLVARPSPETGNAYLRIKTFAHTNRCEKYCNCQCHVQSRIATPRWLQVLVGTLFYSYAGTPILNSPKCNSPRCRRSMVSSTQFCYYFPTWMVRKALIFTSTWRDVTGSGASWSVRVPRVFDNFHPAVSSIIAGNLANLQRILSTREISPFDIDKDGESLLYWAENHRQADIFAYLISIGADMNLKNIFGKSAVDIVWNRRFSNSDAAYNSSVPDIDEDYPLQLSPIHKIILGIVELSLQQQLELDSSYLNNVDWLGRTPLMWAAVRADTTNLRVLIENRANVSATDCEGKTALHIAIATGSYECVKILLQYKADVNICDKFGYTPLHSAARPESLEGAAIIEMLCSLGANLEARDLAGWTPLHFAAYQNRSAAISSLIDCGANINFLNRDGESAIGLAIERGHMDAIWTLYQKGAALNWDMAHPQGNVLGTAAVYGWIQTMEVLSTMSPGKRIIYDPDILYDLYENIRVIRYVGPEEDPDELLAAFENLLANTGTPNPNMKYSDDYPSEDEYMDESDEDVGSDGDMGTYEDEDSDGESSIMSFQDAVGEQEVANLMAGTTLSEPVSDYESDGRGTVAGP
ncbi:ankyrin repeat-containing domain protein [Cadophora sp. MPI-SDFR-AT-0126]|nr:ankyrin repeat-containing domain protein [Leotiomycetes sp. MPI-SDFR-AT-0126]